MTDFIREIQATVYEVREAIAFTLYEHQEPSLASMARHWGPLYAAEQVVELLDR